MIINENQDIKDESSSEGEQKVLFALNQDIQATPTGFKEYGVFCDCGNGYTGLIHISNITTGYVKNVSDYFVIGKPVKTRIIGMKDGTKKQLELSTKVFETEDKGIDSNNNESSRDNKRGFKGLQDNLNTWVKKDSNK